jgi:hypothetical protein
MPKRITPLPVSLQGSPVQTRLLAEWRRRWKPAWERKNGPATITEAEAAYLVFGSVEHKVWAADCVPGATPTRAGEVPAEGWIAPIGLRHFAALFARAPDEALDFLVWARRRGESISGTSVFNAQLHVQAVNFGARLKGKRWTQKDVERSAGVGPKTAEQAIRLERKRVSYKSRGIK